MWMTSFINKQLVKSVYQGSTEKQNQHGTYVNIQIYEARYQEIDRHGYEILENLCQQDEDPGIIYSLTENSDF